MMGDWFQSIVIPVKLIVRDMRGKVVIIIFWIIRGYIQDMCFYYYTKPSNIANNVHMTWRGNVLSD